MRRCHDPECYVPLATLGFLSDQALLRRRFPRPTAGSTLKHSRGLFNMLKNRARKLLSAFGLELRRIPSSTATNAKPLEVALQALLACNGHVRLVQVGANDGKHGDPIYQWVTAHRNQTSILLVEPQQELHQYLMENYRNHPSAQFARAAVGQKCDVITLYRIRPDYWSLYRSPHLVDAPQYRAPSGVTSANRDHVLDYARRFLDTQDPEAAIEQFSIRAVSLRKLLDESGFTGPVDLLQIDVEGNDDDVIYASVEANFRPRVIHFEHKHLGSQRKAELQEFLTLNEYSVCKLPGADWLAFAGNRPA